MRFAFVVLISLVLSACAGGLPWGPQQHSGIETLRVTPITVVGETSKGPVIAYKIFYRSGKETGKASLIFKLPDETTFNFNTDDARAFEGQALRARVEEVVSQQLGESAPDVVDAIIKGLTGGIAQ